ncbi:MAG: SRPBCC domain-containing protein [Chloroflexi bacterium]|nr:SRPBCC domain-containing protein [Chloroflexota bacterium]
MKVVYSRIEINASPERVWEVLTDLPAFPRWNPLLRAVRGELKMRERLEVRLAPATGPRIIFQPTILNVEPNRELRWHSHLLLPGLLASEHTFAIRRLEADRVQFIQSEAFAGLLAPVLSITGLLRQIVRGFDQMNQALKARAEQPKGE